jgi:hypothetical protein
MLYDFGLHGAAQEAAKKTLAAALGTLGLWAIR